MNTEQKPKFKIGDRLMYRKTTTMYNCVVSGINYNKREYIVKWYGEDTITPFSYMDEWFATAHTFDALETDYILYDSPKGVWLRI